MAFQGDSIYWVEVQKIVPNPFQPRKEFNEAKLKELAESIRMYGILQPLTVTRNEIQSDDGAFYTEYELIAGERRLRASKLAGLEQVPVIIRSGEDTEQEKLELAIIENLQREDLNSVDRALAFKQLAEVFKLSHTEVAKKVGRSRMYVSNTIRLLGLPECILNSLSLGDISEGHARTLLMLKERPEEQDVIYREILLKKLTVREVERIARKIATDKVRKKNWEGTDVHLIAIEKEFTDTLGTRVQIAKTNFGGKLTIDYFSDGDLQKLLQMMQAQGKITDAPTAVLSTEDSTESETTIHEMSPEASVLAKLSTTTPLETVEEVPVVSEAEEPSQDTPVIEMGVQEQNSVEVKASTVLNDDTSTPLEHPETQKEIDDSHDDTEVSEGETTESSIPFDEKSSEFSFVTQHTEEARKKDIEPPLSFNPFKKKEIVEEPSKQPSETVEDTPATPTVPEVDDTDDGDMYSMKNFSL